ncbi:calponin -likey domain-containing protein, partial [Asbolus verrucosus]
MEDDLERKRILLKTYFTFWRRKIKIKKEKVEEVKIKIEQRQKLDNLMKTLKKYKKENEERINEIEKLPLKMQQRKSAEHFKNRYEAQKSTIEKLTLQLEEKDRLIDELKLGILNKDALKSINETKVEIRKIFANCSAKVRCKLVPPPDYSEKFMISTQKAPKILQEMEERALERAKKREIILERKRIIEENRKRMIAEALEKKRVQDEEEKKRNLDMIKERRRKELEMEKIRQINKTIFLGKLHKAVALHNKNLIKKGFRSFLYNYRMRLDRVRSMQVAEDFYDLLLQNNTFVRWHRNVCIQIMLREKQIRMAQKHYNRRMLFHFFYQWRSLPAVMQLEKAKEQKKKKWRERVWEVLPDYEPQRNDDYL